MRNLILIFLISLSAQAKESPNYRLELRAVDSHGDAERIVFNADFLTNKFLAQSSKFSLRDRISLGGESAAFLAQEIFGHGKFLEASKERIRPSAPCDTGRVFINVVRGKQRREAEFCNADQSSDAVSSRAWFAFLKQAMTSRIRTR